MLFPVVNDTGRAVYCGIAAIGALTGVPATRIEKMLRRARNDWHRNQTKSYLNIDGKPYYVTGHRPQVKGTYTVEVVSVLERLGCKVTRMRLDVKPTFRGFVDDMQYVRAAFLVELSNHWMAVSGQNIADNANLEPKSFDEAKHGRRYVINAWIVNAPAEPKYTTADTIDKPKAIRKPRDLKAERATKLRLQIDAWERKLKRAQTALKKLRPKLRRYEKMGVVE